MGFDIVASLTPEHVLFNVELLVRIALAAVCGIAVGYERMSHYKAAGVKTHMIVGLSAALIMVVSKYGFADTGGTDGSRVASQIVSGIGFLGAGIIFRRHQTVQGLTTAAGVWGIAGIGMALGAGQYVIGIFGTLLFIVARSAVQHIDRFQNGLQESFSLRMDTDGDMSQLLGLCRDVKTVSYSMQRRGKSEAELEVTLVFANDEQEQAWIESVSARNDILQFERY